MDGELKINADTFLSERCSRIAVSFKKSNLGDIKLIEKINKQKSEIKESVSDEVWQKVKRLFDLLTLQNFVETKYFYARGIKDTVVLSSYLETDFINVEFIDWELNAQSVNKD